MRWFYDFLRELLIQLEIFKSIQLIYGGSTLLTYCQQICSSIVYHILGHIYRFSSDLIERKVFLFVCVGLFINNYGVLLNRY